MAKMTARQQEAVASLKEVFEVVNPQRQGEDKDLKERAQLEYLFMLGVKGFNPPGFKGQCYGVPLRHRGESQIAARFFYYHQDHAFKMRDLRVNFRKFLEKNHKDIKIPIYGRAYPFQVSTLTKGEGYVKGKPFITPLERCIVDGEIPFSPEIVTVEQARYYFGCLERGEPVDDDTFAAKIHEGIKWYEVGKPPVEHSTAPSDGDVEHSTASLPVRSNPLRDKFPTGFASKYLELPPTNGRPVEHSTAPSCALVEHSSALPEILETVRRIEDKVDNLAVIHDPSISSDLSILEEITDTVISQVVGRQVNRMDKGFSFNRRTESYMLRMLERIEERYADLKSYRQVYPLIEYELNDPHTELGGYHTDLSNARLGALKGKPITEHDIKRWHTQYFFIAEVKNIRTGDVDRRLMRMYTDEEE